MCVTNRIAESVMENESNLDAMIPIHALLVNACNSRLDRTDDHVASDRWIHCVGCVTSVVVRRVMGCGTK
jgi:hypothetical protein